MQEAQRIVVEVQALKAMVRAMRYRCVLVWQMRMYFFVYEWRLNAMKNARIHLLSVLKGERDGCSGRMRKQLNGLEAAILRLEDKEEKVKRRAQKVQAYLEWQTEAKATQLSVVAEQWVLAQAIEGNGTGHLLT